jgi:hypothetical protein
MFWYFLLLLVAFAASLVLLWQANLPQRLRHRQLWSPLAAVLTALVVLFLYLRLHRPVSLWWDEMVAQAEAQLGGIGFVPPTGLPIALNLLLLAVYGGAKLLVNLPLRLRADWRGRLGLWPAYQDHHDHGVVLRSEWIFPGILFRYAGWGVGGGLLLLAVLHATLGPLPFAPPFLPVLSVLLLLEVGWYLGGTPPHEQVDEVSGTDVRSRRVGEYHALWEEYKLIWPEQWLTAAEQIPRADGTEPGSNLYRRREGGDEVELAVNRSWHALLAAGHALTDIHYQLLDQLWHGRDVLIGDRTYQSVAPVLFAALRQTLTDGHRVLVLLSSQQQHDDDACGAVQVWLQDGLARAEETGKAWRIAGFDELHRFGIVPDLLVASPEQLLATDALRETWFGKLKTVVVLDAERTVFQAPMHVDVLLRTLRRSRADLQQVILSANRRSLESAMRDNLAAQVREFRTPRGGPVNAYAICWRLEADAHFQHAIMTGTHDRYLGAEAVLALPAWRDGIRPILLLNQEELPWDEQLEELDNHRHLLRDPVPASRVPGSAREVLEVPRLPNALDSRERALVLAHDREHNLADTLRAWLPLGTEYSFVHVVSPPYLLRDYLAANVAYFLRAPLLALSPRLIESRLAVAYAVIERLIAAPLTEDEVLSELRAVLRDARYVEEALETLLVEVFGIDRLERRFLTIGRTDRFAPDRGGFEEVATYQLAPAFRDLRSLHWLRIYRILDRGGHERGLITLDHLFQTYLPGQVHNFQGKPFRIEQVDHASGIVRIDHRSADTPVVYRPVRRLTLEAVRASPHPAYRQLRTEGGWEIEVALCKAGYSVSTHGYYAFDTGINLGPGAFSVTALTEERIPLRTYRDAYVLRLTVRPLTAQPEAEPGRVADTLCLLLQELFVTLYPETHRFLLVCTSGSTERVADEHFRALLPLLSLGESVEPPEPGTLQLYFLEDSHAPLGLLRPLFDEYAHVFAVLEDYLSWVLVDESYVADSWRRRLPERDHFLRFGMEAPPAILDLAGTHGLLRELARGRNPLRSERQAFYRRIQEGRAARSQSDTRQCDFCAGLLPSAEFERLEDGRERCVRCRESAVDSVRELRQVFEEARQFLVRELGQQLRRGIQVEFASANRVQEAAGRSFLPTAEFDARALGAARRRDGEFDILIEQGHPRHRTLGTIVHELTHIWQYSYLDYERMKAEHGLLLIEGLAQWAELTCLERRGLAPEYREQEANRSDVYGHGYRMILDWQKQHARLGNPFEILLHHYPARRRW